MERNRQEHSTRDRNQKRHELLVQKYTIIHSQHVYLEGIAYNHHNHQNSKMHLVRKKPRRLEPLLEKIQANMGENHRPDERDNNSRGERENPHEYTYT